MKQRHIPAFTIMEVTITMLISAILIGITYTAYSIIGKSYSSFHNKNEDMAVFERLDGLLRKDFVKADSIEKDLNGIVLENNQDTIKYQFNPGYITRASGIIDTFKVSSTAIVTLFEGQQVNEVNPAVEQNRIDELEINMVYKNENIPYHYHKQYSSEQLFNRNPDAVN